MARLSDDFIQQIRDHNDIESVIQSYVDLRRRGKNLVGLCPFHNEKTPSFTVYPETASYYCFGCGAKGDVISLVAEHLGLSVEERQVPIEELATFEEAGACGTAAVISPIGKIVDMQTGDIYNYGNEVGEWSMKMYNALQDIQYGRVEDLFGWTRVIEM